MVQIKLPPPTNPPSPIFIDINADDLLFRIYDPTSHGQTGLSFKKYGPNARFDHHRFPASSPGIDADRGIYYSGPTFSGCIAEYFGNNGSILCGERHLAMVRAKRIIQLLDVCGNGAMRAGTVAAISKTEHQVAQAWSNYFYANQEYQSPEGIRYYNAHNDEIAYALYERAESALALVEEIRLDDPDLLPLIAFVARSMNLILMA